jgi:putative MATE family efflux protein
VGNAIGGQGTDVAAVAALVPVVLGVVVAAAIALVGAGFAPSLLRLMGASDVVLATGTAYARVMLGTDVVIILPFLLNAVFRGAGDAAIAMRSLVLANGVNIVLDPVLIFGLGPAPELGVTGAGVATVIGRGIGVGYQLWMLTNGRSRVRVERRHAWWDPPALASLVRLSGSGTFQVFVATASWIGLIRVLATFGSDVVAGYTIGIRVIIFALMPAWGLSNAAATMVGQALGAKDPARAERSVWLAAGYNLAFLGGIGLAFLLAAPPIVDLFGPEGEVRRVAILCLRMVSAGFLFYGVGMVLAQAFNGAGDTRTPLRLNLLCYWAVELPLAYALAKVVGLGPAGAFSAVVVSNTLFTLLAAAIFRRGRWKLTAV